MKRIIFLILVFSSLTFSHDVIFESGKREAFVLKAYFSDGSPLSYANYEIFAPGEKTPYQKGRTDKNGFLSFLPDCEGEWRIKITEESGHGIDTKIKVLNLKDFQAKSGYKWEELIKFFGGLLFITVFFFSFYLLRKIILRRDNK